MAGEPIAKLWVQVGADVSAAKRNLAAFDRSLQGGAVAARRSAAEMDKARTSGERLGSVVKNNVAREFDRLQQAQIRAARASGDFALTIRKAAAAVEMAEHGSVAYYNALAKLSQVQREAAAASQSGSKGLVSLRSGLMGAAGAFGLATSAAGAFTKILEIADQGYKLAATLDEQRRSLGQYMGDQQKANRVFAEAQAFGKRYLFTQKEMGEAVQAASLLIRDSNAPLEQQLSVIARLASLNPAEGISGAAYAIRELASGDIQSIVDRFNLSRKAMNGLKDEVADGVDVFAALDTELRGMNITDGSLEVRTKGAAGAQRELNQELETFGIRLGTLAKSTAWTEWKATMVRGANNLLGSFTNVLPTSAPAHAAVNLENSPATAAATKALQSYNEASAETKTRLEAVATAIQNLNEKNIVATNQLYQQAHTMALTDEDRDQQIAKINTMREEIVALSNALMGQAPASKEQKGAMDAATESLSEHLKKSLEADAATRQLTAAQTDIAGLGVAVAAGFMTSADAAVIMAAKYHLAGDALARLLSLSVQAAGGAKNTIAGSYVPKGANTSAGVSDQTAREQGIANRRARQQYEFSQKTDAEQRAILAQQAAIQQRNGNMEEYYRLLTEVSALDQQMTARAEAEAKRGAKAGAKDARDAERDAERLAKARYALMNDAQKLAYLQSQLAANPPEAERLELMKDIEDIEQRIADTRLKLERALFGDRKARPEELKRLEKARKVLESPNASAAQKEAARLAIAEVQLDQRDRQNDIASYQQSLGGAAGAVGGRAALPVGGFTPIGGGPAIPAGALGPAGGTAGAGVTIVNNFNVDGKTLLSITTPYAMADLLGGLRSANGTGAGRSG